MRDKNLKSLIRLPWERRSGDRSLGSSPDLALLAPPANPSSPCQDGSAKIMIPLGFELLSPRSISGAIDKSKNIGKDGISDGE
jgi:hypothetical protein